MEQQQLYSRSMRLSLLGGSNPDSRISCSKPSSLRSLQHISTPGLRRIDRLLGQAAQESQRKSHACFPELLVSYKESPARITSSRTHCINIRNFARPFLPLSLQAAGCTPMAFQTREKLANHPRRATQHHQKSCGTSRGPQKTSAVECSHPDHLSLAALDARPCLACQQLTETKCYRSKDSGRRQINRHP